tara:strand:+ start:1850 stop:2008 length:159 start_codon:yes stop_codon:yes gene_type:complete
MAFQGNHYLATFDLPDGTTPRIEVYAKDDSDARRKVDMIYPTASNVVISAVN